MRSELFDIIIPSVCFFIAFFMAYSFAETMIIVILNRIIFRYWGLTPEKLIESRQLYGKKIKFLTFAAVVALLALLTHFTGFIKILLASTTEIKALAAETLLAMALIYITTTRPLTKCEAERSIHKYLYIYLSVIVFIFTIITADQSYGQYKDFINANVTTTIRGVEKRMEKNEKDTLIEKFRQQIYKGACDEIDYLKKPGGIGVTNFVYISTNDDLIRAKTAYEEDTDFSKDLRGRECTNGVETFLLTDHGRWYWVIDA